MAARAFSRELKGTGWDSHPCPSRGYPGVAEPLSWGSFGLHVPVPVPCAGGIGGDKPRGWWPSLCFTSCWVKQRQELRFCAVLSLELTLNGSRKQNVGACGKFSLSKHPSEVLQENQACFFLGGFVQSWSAAPWRLLIPTSFGKNTVLFEWEALCSVYSKEGDSQFVFC